jgi:hypothetical protein
MEDMLENMNKAGSWLGKYAQKNAEERSALKDALLVAGGTGVGAGLGYGAAALLKKRYGDVYKGLPPNERLKYLVPASAVIGGASALTHVLRQRAEAQARPSQQKRAHMLLGRYYEPDTY